MFELWVYRGGEIFFTKIASLKITIIRKTYFYLNKHIICDQEEGFFDFELVK